MKSNDHADAGRSAMPGSIMGRARQWNVRIPIWRDPATGKVRNHYKTIRGSRGEAVVYLEWYSGLIAAGVPPQDVITQSELQDLAELERTASAFREKLLVRMQVGARVQPGPRSLS
jgi:hypothetical protein